MSYRAPSASMSVQRPVGPSTDPRVARGGAMNPCDQLWYDTLLGYSVSHSGRPGFGPQPSPQLAAAIAAAGRAVADQARANCLAAGGATSAGGGGSGVAPYTLPGLRGLGLDIMSPAQQKAYWNARAQQCKGFADEGACLSRIARHVPITIVPGFSGLGALGTMLGPDTPPHSVGDMVSVSAAWAQRAVNAFNQHNGSSARISVTGGVGPATMAGLQAATHILPPGTPPDDLRVTHDPSTATGTTARALISQALYAVLPTLTVALDPTVTASGSRTPSSSPSPSSSSSSSGGKTGVPSASDPGSDPGSNPANVKTDPSVIPSWVLPVAIVGGAVAVVGIAYAVSKRRASPTKNSRRKHKHKRRR